MTTKISPFTVAIPDDQLQDLKQRLARTRWPERETCQDWSQGIPLEYTRELAHYWANDYDWRRFERRLNEWPQFVTGIDGIDIHFIHRRSPHADALPIIISHGWPGSPVEFHKVIDALADPVAHGVGHRGDGGQGGAQEGRPGAGQEALPRARRVRPQLRAQPGAEGWREGAVRQHRRHHGRRAQLSGTIGRAARFPGGRLVCWRT